MTMLNPKLAILDETDSGLMWMPFVRFMRKFRHFQALKMLCLSSPLQQILQYIKPDHVHIMVDGKIVLSGDASLADRIEKNGYESIKGNVVA